MALPSLLASLAQFKSEADDPLDVLPSPHPFSALALRTVLPCCASRRHCDAVFTF